MNAIQMGMSKKCLTGLRMPCAGNGEYNSHNTAPKMLFLVAKWRNVACIKMRKSTPW